MADLVRRGPSEMERIACGAGGAEAGVRDDDTVGFRRAAGELRVTEDRPVEPVAQIAAYPDVEVVLGRPRVGASRCA